MHGRHAVNRSEKYNTWVLLHVLQWCTIRCTHHSLDRQKMLLSMMASKFACPKTRIQIHIGERND